MKKIVLLILICFTFCNCNERKITKDDFKNKTFNFITQDLDTLKIEFKDSTFIQLGQDLYERKWSLVDYRDAEFLILNEAVFGINIDEGSFLIEDFISNKVKFNLLEEKKEWTKEKIYGKWFPDEFINIDSTDLTLLPDFENEAKFKTWPPYYLISNDSICFEFYGYKNTSKISIDNSNKYIRLNLKNRYELNEDVLWEIKELNDSIMIIEKFSKENGFYNHNFDKITKNYKLIKSK